jgi:hypothetical protein
LRSPPGVDDANDRVGDHGVASQAVDLAIAFVANQQPNALQEQQRGV